MTKNIAAHMTEDVVMASSGSGGTIGPGLEPPVDEGLESNRKPLVRQRAHPRFRKETISSARRREKCDWKCVECERGADNTDAAQDGQSGHRECCKYDGCANSQSAGIWRNLRGCSHSDLNAYVSVRNPKCCTIGSKSRSWCRSG